MLPRIRTARAVIGGIVVALVMAPVLVVAPVSATRPGEWTSSDWTGFAPGAPVPDPSLTAAMPAPLTPMPYLPIAYEGQSVCDPSPKPGAVAIAETIKAVYGAQQVIGIPRGCEIGGRSEHKEGRAVDWMVDIRTPEERAMAEAYLNWLLGPDQAGRMHGHAFQLGVMYIGWNDRIWRGYRSEIGWAELKGCFSKPEEKYDNYCHRNHIHISLTLAGAAGSTIPVDVSPAPELPPRPPAPAQPGVDDDAFMSVGAAVGFAAGDDLPLGAGELRTVDLAAVPLNASSALVYVTTRQAARKGTMRIGMVDAAAAVPVRVPKRRVRGTVLQVPVANGAVQIAGPSEGAVSVRVDVLGYTIAGGNHPAVGGAPEVLFRGRLAPKSAETVSVRGVGVVPRKKSKSTAVILRVTTKGRGDPGRVTAYPVGGVDLGTASAPVPESGERSSIIAADIGADGRIALATSVRGKVLVEVIGYVRR
jgi:hypothetical protein